MPSLALRNLTYQPRRLLTAVGGVGFAIVLMFMELGFMYALLDSTVKLVDDIDGDLIMTSPARFILPADKRFPRSRLVQAMANPAVSHAEPIYMERSTAQLRELPRGVPQPVRVIAVRPGGTAYQRDLFDTKTELSEPNTAAIDLRSKSDNFAFAFEAVATRERVDLSGTPLRVVGTFHLATDFANDGSLLMNTRSFARYFPWRRPLGNPLDSVDLGVLTLLPSSNREKVRTALNETLPADVAVYTKAEFRQREIDFWNQNTPVGLIFQMGTWMGFIVGVIVCYQVIQSGISDHLHEYATLKAMGYRGSYFLRVVAAQAVYLSMFAFLPALLLTWGIYELLGNQTGLLLVIQPLRVLGIYCLTLLMCLASGLLALVKLLRADPAELY